MTKIERHEKISKELKDLYEKKNHDYGDSFHKTFEEEGFAMSRIRLTDKLERFKALTRGNDPKVSDESIRDTLIDLANYAIMTIMEMDVKTEEDIKLRVNITAADEPIKAIKPELPKYNPYINAYPSAPYCACWSDVEKGCGE